MQIPVELKLPMMPSHLTVLGLPMTTVKPGWKELPTIDVACLTEEQVTQFIKEWSDEFRLHVAKRRKLVSDQVVMRG